MKRAAQCTYDNNNRLFEDLQFSSELVHWKMVGNYESGCTYDNDNRFFEDF